MTEKEIVKKLLQDAMRIKKENEEMRAEIKEIENNILVKKAEIIANGGKYEN